VTTTTAKGHAAEGAAAAFVSRRGWTVLARNHRTPAGELDLVCADGSVVVVVEVKARSGDLFGGALESIGPRKQRRLRASAAWWMASYGWAGHSLRFDAIEVSLDAEGQPRSLALLPDVLGSGR
jgi:putative endonuclease